MDTKEIDVITRDVTRDTLLGINKETIQGFRVVTIRTICMHRGTDRSDIFSMIRRQIGGVAISHASAVAAILRCMNYFTGRDARSLVDGSNRGDTLYRVSGFAENATLVAVLHNYE